MSHRNQRVSADRLDASEEQPRIPDPHHKLLDDCAKGSKGNLHPHKGEHGACKSDSVLPNLSIAGIDSHKNSSLKIDELVNEKTTSAIMQNEQRKRGIKDYFEDAYSKNISAWPNFDIGPAKMSEKQIAELKHDPKYAKQLQDADPYTESGAKKLITAYLQREADRLEHGDYEKGNDQAFNTDRPGDVRRPIVRGNFNEMQTLWNEARKSNDLATQRKVLEETYNAGLHTDQIRQVESIRSGTAPEQIEVGKWQQKPKKQEEDEIPFPPAPIF